MMKSSGSWRFDWFDYEIYNMLAQETGKRIHRVAALIDRPVEEINEFNLQFAG